MEFSGDLFSEIVQFDCQRKIHSGEGEDEFERQRIPFIGPDTFFCLRIHFFPFVSGESGNIDRGIKSLTSHGVESVLVLHLREMSVQNLHNFQRLELALQVAGKVSYIGVAADPVIIEEAGAVGNGFAVAEHETEP